MHTHSMTFSGRMGSESPRPNPADCKVHVTITGEKYLESRVRVQLNDRDFLRTSQLGFFKFCNYAKGKPSRVWQNALLDSEITDLQLWLPQNMTTVEQNILKACFLVYVWIEPVFVGRSSKPSNILVDEFIVDYTGNVGTQQFIYFLSSEYENQDVDTAMQRLYELQLLCQMNATISGEQIHRWFTPLVLPGVLIDRFGETVDERKRNYTKWLGIKAHLQSAVQRFMRRGS